MSCGSPRILSRRVYRLRTGRWSDRASGIVWQSATKEMGLRKVSVGRFLLRLNRQELDGTGHRITVLLECGITWPKSELTHDATEILYSLFTVVAAG